MRRMRSLVRLAVMGSIGAFAAGAAPALVMTGASTSYPAVLPTISDWQFISAGTAPPSEAACNAKGRRCFDPAAMAGSYDYATLHSAGDEGQGTTIAIVDSFGSATIGSDLNNFDTQFNLPQMCGDTGIACTAGMPSFHILNVQGSPPPLPQPPNNGTGQENHAAWALEVSLDVEWSHATAPLANILLVTVPTAETLGVQGFPLMMNAEQYVIDHHMADVISQSFAATEASFSSFASLQNLRHAFISAAQQNVTVFGSAGDGGTTNSYKEPVKNPATVPYPSVNWPASDPLVTSVGGTDLCTNTTDGTTIDSTSPPAACQNNPTQREVVWPGSGGGYSIYFLRPSFQDPTSLPAGSTYTGTSAGAPGPNAHMRGVPDISYQASPATGVLVYITEPGFSCGGASPCSSGWYVVGGTSSGSPQWAGLIAMADQMGGHDVGYINPALYALAANPVTYAKDFHDVTVGSNQTSASIPGYSASPGWDAATGLGTPDAANLLPDLIASP
jgi:subtilase family serine protease